MLFSFRIDFTIDFWRKGDNISNREREPFDSLFRS
jgi:hypothetical protein